jgi:hypothetical protein
LDNSTSEVSHARERFPFFHLISLLVGLVTATGAVASMDASFDHREPSAAGRAPRAQVQGAYRPKHQPVTVYIVDSQKQADVIEQDAAAGGTDDEGNVALPIWPREYLIGGSAEADEEVEEAAMYMLDLNEISEASGTGPIYRVIDLRRRR